MNKYIISEKTSKLWTVLGDILEMNTKNYIDMNVRTLSSNLKRKMF